MIIKENTMKKIFHKHKKIKEAKIKFIIKIKIIINNFQKTNNFPRIYFHG